MTNIHVSYDPAVDAAYISLPRVPLPGSSATMYACDPDRVGGMINLDFDHEGRLIGIEILGASAKLLPELLESAERDDSA